MNCLESFLFYNSLDSPAAKIVADYQWAFICHWYFNDNEPYEKFCREHGVPPGRRVFLCDVFGAGTAAAGVATAAATVAAAEINADAQAETNEMNLQIHREDNAFNAAEAQKSREWNSASAIMERNKEAGINPVLGGESATPNTPSQAQASSAPAPTMQAPQIDLSGVAQGFNAALGVAKVASEIKGNNASAKHSLEQADYLRITKIYQPDILQSTIDDNKASVQMKRACANQYQAVASKSYIDGYLSYIYAEGTKYSMNRDTEALRTNITQRALEYSGTINLAIADITATLKKYSMSTRELDEKIKNTLRGKGFGSGSQYEQGSTNQFGWNAGGKIGASVSGEAGFTGVIPTGKVGASGNFELSAGVNGSNSTSESSGFNEFRNNSEQESTNESELAEKYKQSEVAYRTIEAAIYCRLQTLDSLSDELRQHCLSRMREFNADFNTFKGFMNNMFSYQTSMNQIIQ